jgi:hypothetical protein
MGREEQSQEEMPGVSSFVREMAHWPAAEFCGAFFAPTIETCGFSNRPLLLYVDERRWQDKLVMQDLFQHE